MLSFRHLVATAGLLGACNPSSQPGEVATETATAAEPSAVIAPARGRTSNSTRATLPAGSVTVIAGGDVSFGRLRGKRLLREPHRNDFDNVQRLFDAADLRFVNLESTISEQDGETQSPINKLVFTAPPAAADALARAKIDIVSLANNHAWDYGKSGLVETFTRLDKAGVAWVGAGRSRADAYAARVVERQGFKIAFVAVTAVWNQVLDPHPGYDFVADADQAALVAAIRKARAIDGIHKVVVSHHGGYEYLDQPHEQTRTLLRAAIDAGADAVIGHHPHVVQRVAIYRNKPILYSLGNLLMRMVTGKPWTEFGTLARLSFHHGGPTGVELCPFRIYGLDPVLLSDDPRRSMYQRYFRYHMDRLQHQGSLVAADSAAKLGEFSVDGCAPITAGG